MKRFYVNVHTVLYTVFLLDSPRIAGHVRKRKTMPMANKLILTPKTRTYTHILEKNYKLVGDCRLKRF